jgi:glycosyltransferase involved in cell wall biosynthesis
MYISIIIPTYNAEKTLENCLQAIFNSSYQKFEVLLVDDGSQDNSVKIARSFSCKVLHCTHNRGASAARNWGAKNAEGDALLFIDADIVIKKDTLNLFVSSLKKHPVVFGIYTQQPGVDGLLSLYQNYYAHKSIQETEELTSMFYSYCAAIKRTLFNELGGFDEGWIRATFEDVEFGMRLTEHGHQIFLNKNIEVVHHNNYTLKRFVKNYFYKSLDLAKLMLSKKKLTLNNEGWTTYRNQISFLAGLSTIFLALLSLVSSWFIVPLLITLVIFLSSNLNFYKFILQEKPAGLCAAIILNFMVQIVAALGIIAGQLSFLKEKGLR